jgi:hypothetical protein
VDAGEFDVDVSAEAGVEKQVPARVMIVRIDEDAIAVPIPVAAARRIVGGDDPVGVVRQEDAASVNVESVDDKLRTDMFVMAVRIETAWTEMLMRIVVVDFNIAPHDSSLYDLLVVVPVLFMFDLANVAAIIVVIVATIFLLDLAIVLAVVMMIVAVLGTLGGHERAR